MDLGTELSTNRIDELVKMYTSSGSSRKVWYFEFLQDLHEAAGDAGLLLPQSDDSSEGESKSQQDSKTFVFLKARLRDRLAEAVDKSGRFDLTLSVALFCQFAGVL